MERSAEAIPLVNLALAIDGSAFLERRLSIFSRLVAGLLKAFRKQGVIRDGKE
jgi:hypothetical protein